MAQNRFGTGFMVTAVRGSLRCMLLTLCSARAYGAAAASLGSAATRSSGTVSGSTRELSRAVGSSSAGSTELSASATEGLRASEHTSATVQKQKMAVPKGSGRREESLERGIARAAQGSHSTE
eukprot:Amastigsp_a688724_26.p3 type:complete len:123 gc:universal Amastigsp_a688724_26:409-41(-)